jgi:N utilization substance protein B
LTKRRKSREYALQFLYRIDFVAMGQASDKLQLHRDFEEFWRPTGEEDPEVMRFAEELVSGTVDHLEEIDLQIEKAADKWKLTRMATIDRNIMRLAVYEILYRSDIPSAVSINEALEIAKKFSTIDSASFINGLLDRIAKEAGPKG